MRFGQGLIQSLINPSYGQGLFTAGQGMGQIAAGIPQQARQAQEAEQQRQQAAQRGMLTAYQTGREPGGSDPMAVVGALQEATGASAPDLIKMMEAGEAQAKDTSALTGKDRYVPVGNKIYDMLEGKWMTPPDQNTVEQMTPTQIAKLYESFTPESVSSFIKNPQEASLTKLSETNEVQEKIEGRANVASKLLATDSLMSDIDKAKNAARDSQAGTYDLAKFIPLTPARNLSGLIKRIDANLAFDRLQKMRDESKTGGALGQVSNIELDLLRSSVASLDPAAGDDVFIDRLDQVRNHYNNFKNSLLGLPPSSSNYKENEGKLYYKNPEDGAWYDLGEVN